MKKLLLFFISGIIFMTWACEPETKKSEILFVPDEKKLVNLEVSKNTHVGIMRSGTDLKFLQIRCSEEKQSPYVIIHDKSKTWKLSNYNYLAAEITNLDKKEVLVEIRLDADGWGAQGKVVEPGETQTVRMVIPQDKIPEYYDKKIIGMYNLPDGIIKSGKVTDSIHKISFVIPCPSEGTNVLISRIRGEGRLKFPTKEQVDRDFFPLLDEYGQYRHADWPIKTHSLEELRKATDVEQADISSHPKPAVWDQYGGWLKGPKLKATGNFRTEKVDGKWWLVDPLGYLFWSHGMGSVAIGGGAGVITDREFYFTSLPDSVKYREFYRTRQSAPFGYYKNRKMVSFDIIAWNMMQKYGDNWKEKGIKLAVERLESWGQNTFGAWTSSEVFLNNPFPYTPIIMIASKKLEGSIGHWYKFIDPFDTSMIGNLTRKIQAIGKSTTDPYCIGYYVDNEYTWGDSTSMARWTIASPADQAAKVAMLEFLKKKYSGIKDFNTRWGTGFASWDAFMDSTKLLNIKNEDTKEFTRIFIEKYFQNVLNTIRKLAPGKLYLGPRLDYHFYPSESNLNPWDFRNNWIVNIAAQYCDVVSFNRYRSTAADLRPGDFDKPIIVGEWHHTPLEKGSFYMGPEHYKGSLAMRAEKYDYFIKSCLNNPFIVGAHYFQYLDQPTVGRGDGENFSCGFLTICDRPYNEMINMSRKTGHEMYYMRYSGK